MATAASIDTKALVNRFLSRQVVTPASEDSADSSEEIVGVLESVGLSFLLFPQAVLSVVSRARNALQQLVQLDIALVDFMVDTLEELQNPNDQLTDTSDLVEARTALLELDRVGRVDPALPSFSRFNAAVNRMLDGKLAKPLKRHNLNRFERTGVEARTDLQEAITRFVQVHAMVALRLAELGPAVEDFQAVDVSRLVSSRTFTRVRSLLAQLQNGVQQGAVSNTVLAIELLSTTSALQAISGRRGVYDPTIKTGTFPLGRTITVSAVAAVATALSTEGPWDISGLGTPWLFAFDTEAASYSLELPATGASGDVYVLSTLLGQATYNIPASRKLYVVVGSTYFAVALPSGGAVTTAAILTALNTAFGVTATAATLDGAGRLMIYAAAQITVLGIGRAVDFAGTLDDASGHDILGFLAGQASKAAGVFDATDLKDVLATRAPTAVFVVEEEDRLKISSASAGDDSSLTFAGEVAEAFGFEGAHVSEPAALQLVEDGQALEPGAEGVFVGSRFSAVDASGRSLFAPVTSIDGTSLFFGAAALPRGTGLSVTVDSQLAVATQFLLGSLSTRAGLLDQDLFSVQRVLTPLLSQPTLAQINDARRVFVEIRAKLTTGDPVKPALLEILQGSIVPPSRDAFDSIAAAILNSLEDRGLDRASDLLRQCLFSRFFGLSKETASKSANFLSSLAATVRAEFPVVTNEEDISDGNPTGGVNPDTDLLRGSETSA
jgi:hypothetical protein